MPLFERAIGRGHRAAAATGRDHRAAAQTRGRERETAAVRNGEIVVFDRQHRVALRTTRERINEALDRAVRRDER